MKFLIHSIVVLLPAILAGQDAITPKGESDVSGDLKARQLYASFARLGKKQDKTSFQTFKAYLEKQWTKKKTTKAEVIELLGKPSLNLDRPERDQIDAFQYTLSGGGANQTFLWVEFEKTKPYRLSNYGIGLCICGFCPHVFASDGEGQWRLEGKLLAGCVGKENTGWDALTLPRSAFRGGKSRVLFSNLASEREYLYQVEIAKVPLRAGEEVVVDSKHEVVSWTPSPNSEYWPGSKVNELIPLGQNENGLVLEIRNTPEFEPVMRAHYLDGLPKPGNLDLVVSFGGEKRECIKPVGTKFLRRIFVPVPNGATTASLECSALWEVRRVWTGTWNENSLPVVWIRPEDPGSQILNPGESRVYSFQHRQTQADNWGFVIRARGYYEFIDTE